MSCHFPRPNHPVFALGPYASARLICGRFPVIHSSPPAACETGWDVFSLSYNAAAGLPAAAGGAAAGGGGAIPGPSSGPLSALFTQAAMMSYNRLARLLWRIKRAEHALSATWGAAACGLQRMVDKMGPGAWNVRARLGWAWEVDKLDRLRRGGGGRGARTNPTGAS
jgi:hypothetical protein